MTKERLARVQEKHEAIATAIPEAFAGDAHALLMTVYKDPSNPIDLRVDAAKAAIRFEKPALSNVEAKVEQTVRDISDEELRSRLADSVRRVGPILGWSVQ